MPTRKGSIRDGRIDDAVGCVNAHMKPRSREEGVSNGWQLRVSDFIHFLITFVPLSIYLVSDYIVISLIPQFPDDPPSYLHSRLSLASRTAPPRGSGSSVRLPRRPQQRRH